MPCVQRLKAITTDAWLGLLREHPPDPRPAPRDTWETLGLYLVAGLVLALNYYAAPAIFAALPATWTHDALPGADRLVWISATIMFYTIPPILYLRFILHRPLRDMGLSMRGFTCHLHVYLTLALTVLTLVYLVSGTPHFLKTYPMARDTAAHGGMLMAWMSLYALQFVGLEFFFRGFLVHGPARVLGAWAVPIMVIPYMTLHFQKPWLETGGAVIAGMALGMIALKTRSICAGILLHITVAWFMELMALYHIGKMSRLLGE